MADKMTIGQLNIEVTRKCNMSCEHCLRGCSENLDIKKEYITDILEKTKHISDITLTGGEPSLNCEAIQHFISETKRLKVSVGYFYIATNAKEATDEFMKAVLDLYLICEEKEMCNLDISNDYFHELEGQHRDELDKLLAFKFTTTREYKQYDDNWISEGSYKDISGKGSSLVADSYYVDLEDNSIQDGVIYLNAKGNIIAGCDWSYESQEREDLFICKSSELSPEVVQAFEDKRQAKESAEIAEAA